MISKQQAEEILQALEDGDLSKYGLWEIGIILNIREQTGCSLITNSPGSSCFAVIGFMYSKTDSDKREEAFIAMGRERKDLLSHATTAQLLFLKMKYGISIT